MRNLMVSLSLLVALVLVGCDRDSTAQSNPEPAADAIPASLVLATAPSDARDVKAAKEGVKPGDDVVIHGVIGGREEPIAANRAIITVIDPSIQTCDKMKGDTCKTPWDACCVDQQEIAAGAATLQVVNDKGQPLKVGLKGHKGIEPLKDVTVVGKVRSADANNLVIDATGIYVKG